MHGCWHGCHGGLAHALRCVRVTQLHPVGSFILCGFVSLVVRTCVSADLLPSHTTPFSLSSQRTVDRFDSLSSTLARQMSGEDQEQETIQLKQRGDQEPQRRYSRRQQVLATSKQTNQQANQQANKQRQQQMCKQNKGKDGWLEGW